MSGKPRLVGMRGYTPVNSPPPSENEFEFVFTYDPDSNASLTLSAPPSPPKKGFFSKMLPWLFK